jgi:hypothetical protein
MAGIKVWKCKELNRLIFDFIDRKCISCHKTIYPYIKNIEKNKNSSVYLRIKAHRDEIFSNSINESSLMNTVDYSVCNWCFYYVWGIF